MISFKVWCDGEDELDAQEYEALDLEMAAEMFAEDNFDAGQDCLELLVRDPDGALHLVTVDVDYSPSFSAMDDGVVVPATKEES